MSAGKYNLNIEQGATYGIEFVYTDDNKVPVDLTNWLAKLQIRDTKDAKDALYDADVKGDLTMTPLEGKITLVIDTETTTAFDFDNGFYDLELTDEAGEVTRLVEGRVYLSKEVTK